MTIALWCLQVLLALHTVAGALWKLSNSADRAVPTLAAIPSSVWIAMCFLELACAIGLVAPLAKRSLEKVPGVAALIIAAEMLLFTAVHLTSAGAHELGPVFYWLVVAGLCGVVAWGRLRRV